MREKIKAPGFLYDARLCDILFIRPQGRGKDVNFTSATKNAAAPPPSGKIKWFYIDFCFTRITDQSTIEIFYIQKL